MSLRREASQRAIADELAVVQRLREQGAAHREGHDPALRQRARYRHDEPPAPPGGWKPILDDDGNVIPDPPPSEPTDVQEPGDAAP